MKELVTLYILAAIIETIPFPTFLTINFFHNKEACTTIIMGPLGIHPV